MKKRVLFNFEQVIELSKKYQSIHESKNMDDYEHGIVDGIEFVLFLTERMEK